MKKIRPFIFVLSLATLLLSGCDTSDGKKWVGNADGYDCDSCQTCGNNSGLTDGHEYELSYFEIDRKSYHYYDPGVWEKSDSCQIYLYFNGDICGILSRWTVVRSDQEKYINNYKNMPITFANDRWCFKVFKDLGTFDPNMFV